MQPYAIALTVSAAVVLIFIMLFAAALVCNKIASGKRLDKNPEWKYFTAEDFSLHTEAVELRSGKDALRGFIYGGADCKRDKLIIFCHGMGAGQAAYTKEIAYLCGAGYRVLAIDSTGCNLSDGRDIRGFYEGVNSAVAAIDFAAGDARLKNMSVCLVGHSWGAYSVLCASARRKAESVVAISAFSSPAEILRAQAGAVISRPFAALLCPFWRLINFLRFGRYGNADAAKCAASNGARTLLVHGDEDKIVELKYSAYAKANGGNIEKMLVKGRAHNPYATDRADKLTQQLIARSLKPRRTEEDREFVRSFDFDAATEEDGAVMQAIVDFIG